jgi:hypothetical protein
MPGVIKQHRQTTYRRAFPASRYNDPRGGRASALERNVLRYRAIEAALYLHYAEYVRDFMLTNIHPQSHRTKGAGSWQTTKARRLEALFAQLVSDAEQQKSLSKDEASDLRAALTEDGRQGKKLKAAFGHAVGIGMFTQTEADEVKALLDYRNDIAHRIHRVMSDITRTSFVSDHIAFSSPTYKGDALDRLRAYRRSLWERTQGLPIMLMASMDSLLFEMAERVFEEELKRLDRLIVRQIKREHRRLRALNAELDLSETELVGDLDPRFPENHRPGLTWCDDYTPPTGHLTNRGVEICYRLFDLGKSPLSVAWLMGISLKAAKARKRSWLNVGGAHRIRAEIQRYDLKTGRKLACST